MGIFGQDKGDRVARGLHQRARRGWGDQRKQVGSFLLRGRRGVGKTEVSGVAMDGVWSSASRYVQSNGEAYGCRGDRRAAGYGRLPTRAGWTEAIDKHPHCVLLADEARRLPGMCNLLLAASWDHGTFDGITAARRDFRSHTL